MKKYTVILTFIFCLIFLIGSPLVSTATEWKIWDKEPTVNDKNKSWTITFNKPVDPNTVNYGETVRVIKNSGNGEQQQSTISIAKDQKSITIHAPKNGYEYGTYMLGLSNIKSVHGEILVPTVMGFSVEPLQLESIEDPIELPKIISIAENNVVKELDVKWNKDKLFFEDGAYKVKGTVSEINEEITMEIILEETYLSNLFDNLIPVLPPEEDEEDYRVAKTIEFFLKEAVKDPGSLIDREKLLQAHLKGTINQTTVNVIMNEVLDKFVFDTTIPKEKEISACLSDAFSSHIFISVSETPAKYEECVEKIFDYINDTFGFDPKAITKATFDNITLPSDDRTFSNMAVALKNEVDGMSGYWLYLNLYSGKYSLFQLKESKDGKITGYQYILKYFGENDVFEVMGNRESSEIKLRSYINKDSFDRNMKSWSKKKYTYLGDYSYYFDITIDSSTYFGNQKSSRIYENGKLAGIYDEYRIKMERVPTPKLKDGVPFVGYGEYDEYDYLEELIKKQ